MSLAKDIPTRVTVEITGECYCTRVYAGDVLLVERSIRMVSKGEGRWEQPGDFYTDLPDFDELADELMDLDPFGTAQQLRELSEES